MATAPETQQLNVRVSPDTIKQVDQLAQDPRYGSKAKVVEAALDALVGAGMDDRAIANLQQQISAMQTSLVRAIMENGGRGKEPADSLDERLTQVEQRLTHLVTQQLQFVRQELTHAYDTLNQRLPPVSSTPPPRPPRRRLWVRLQTLRAR